MHVKSPIDKPKKAVAEIMPGFLKDNNLRIVYEALKVSFLHLQKWNFLVPLLKRKLSRLFFLPGAFFPLSYSTGLSFTTNNP